MLLYQTTWLFGFAHHGTKGSYSYSQMAKKKKLVDAAISNYMVIPDIELLQRLDIFLYRFDINILSFIEKNIKRDCLLGFAYIKRRGRFFSLFMRKSQTQEIPVCATFFPFYSVKKDCKRNVRHYVLLKGLSHAQVGGCRSWRSRQGRR